MALSLLWEHCIAAFLKDVFVSHSNSEATVDSYAYARSMETTGDAGAALLMQKFSGL